jgi:hypothetical protein
VNSPDRQSLDDIRVDQNNLYREKLIFEVELLEVR